MRTKLKDLPVHGGVFINPLESVFNEPPVQCRRAPQEGDQAQGACRNLLLEEKFLRPTLVKQNPQEQREEQSRIGSTWVCAEPTVESLSQWKA